MTISTVAVIGLGNMGRPMANNLVGKGFTVVGFDIVPAAMDILPSLGATGAKTMQEAVADADCVITMLPLGDDVRGAYFGDGGLLACAPPDALLIDSSTISSTVSVDIGAAADAAGRSFLDAPVSGGTPGAHAGTLTFMVGGAAKDLARAMPVLEAMGAKIVHVGANGAGHTAKLCNNMLSGICMIGTAEAIALGVANGIEPAILHEIMRSSSGTNYALEKYSPVPGIMANVPSSHGYAGGFRSSFQLKDMRLARQLASERRSLSPLGNLACELFDIHCRMGQGELDYSSVIKLFTDLSEQAQAGNAGASPPET